MCNGPGEIHECGCADILEGDHDRNGNQLDALGVCAVTAPKTLTPMASVTTWMTGRRALTLVASATDQERSTNADVRTSQKATGDRDGNQLDALGERGGDALKTLTPMVCDDVDDCGRLDAWCLQRPRHLRVRPGGSRRRCDCDGNQLDALEGWRTG